MKELTRESLYCWHTATAAASRASVTWKLLKPQDILISCLLYSPCKSPSKPTGDFIWIMNSSFITVVSKLLKLLVTVFRRLNQLSNPAEGGRGGKINIWQNMTDLPEKWFSKIMRIFKQILLKRENIYTITILLLLSIIIICSILMPCKAEQLLAMFRGH